MNRAELTVVLATYTLTAVLTFCYLLNETSGWACYRDRTKFIAHPNGVHEVTNYFPCNNFERVMISAFEGAIWPIFWTYRLTGKAFGKPIFYTARGEQ